ncbi:hypothetical protein JOAD_173 [Erwinia phage vB_EamM_Joad]|uniref:Uncharacterized protein n=1 Tax=Erwinia phage vB_EamM_Joad TaxID=2026081 RepID=A0A223LIC8_9CAUD|nr:hypothetical protein JOAD_173 [Erwinia phage vB_EamM_Joad]
MLMDPFSTSCVNAPVMWRKIMSQLKTRMNDAFLDHLLKTSAPVTPKAKPDFTPPQPTTFRQIFSTTLEKAKNER